MWLYNWFLVIFPDLLSGILKFIGFLSTDFIIIDYRWNSQTMDELQRMREMERERNLLRNMKLPNQPMDGGVYVNP